MADKTTRPAVDKSYRRWEETMKSESNALRKIALVAFSVDFMKAPEDALINWDMSGERLEKYIKNNFERLVKRAAKATGGDPAQIADKDRRTEEQHRALLEASAEEQVARIDLFFKSNYMQATKAIEPLKGRYKDNATEDEYTIKETVLLYFFATHVGINPQAHEGLTDENISEITTLFSRLDAFYADNESIYGDGTLQAFIEQDSPERAGEILPRIFSVIPEKQVIPNTKLSDTITKDILDAGKVAITVSKAGAREPVDTTCILTYESDNVKLSGRRSFTEFDRNVYNAVTSLYVYGSNQHIVTPAMVYRAMTGLRSNEKPTPQQLEAVTTSLDKMRFIRAQIDCTAELEMRKLTIDGEQIKRGIIDTYLLTAEAVRVNAGGNEVTAYHIIKTPVLYEYAAALRHVLTVSMEIVDIKKLDKAGKPTTHSLAYTEQRVLIKGYLLRRIEGMKNDKNALKSKNIAFLDYKKGRDPDTGAPEVHQGLYSIAGKSNPTKDDTRYIRADAEAMLKYWTATGYIKGYATYKKGKALAGFSIDV